MSAWMNIRMPYRIKEDETPTRAPPTLAASKLSAEVDKVIPTGRKGKAEMAKKTVPALRSRFTFTVSEGAIGSAE